MTRSDAPTVVCPVCGNPGSLQTNKSRSKNGLLYSKNGRNRYFGYLRVWHYQGRNGGKARAEVHYLGRKWEYTQQGLRPTPKITTSAGAELRALVGAVADRYSS